MSQISGVNNYTNAYSAYSTAAASKTTAEASTSASTSTDTAAVYTPSSEGVKKASTMDRSAIINQMKADSESRINQMQNLVNELFSKQGIAIGTADDMWKKLASGDFTVDAATKAQAKADISEDGYWGVKQTSQRIFDFAVALSGGDPDQMEKMRSAFEKGFKMATGTWGKELPEISQQTYAATQKLFDDYAASKAAGTEA